MKRPDPTEAPTNAGHSPSPPPAKATVGHTAAPSLAETWARQLGLGQPLALILHTLRSDEYLGTALNYLSQDVPRALLQRWAPEVDFVDDLLALGDAYATSEGIQKDYRPLRMDTPIRQQMKDGAVSKHPFAAVVARRISTTNPDNDAWLETLRAWWALQFLEAEARGDKLGKRRVRIGLAIRMCVLETTGRGLWTPVMTELLGPDHDYRKLHEHLVDYAGRTYKQPECVGGRQDLLRALAHIDAPDDEDLEVLPRAHAQAVGTRYDDSTYAMSESPPPPALQLSAHWLEDWDEFPTNVDGETELSSPNSRPLGLECAAVDENRSGSQQEKQASVLQLLSIEEQQRLPYSWSKPNPHERDLLTNWWKNLWRKPDHPDHDLAVLTYLAAQTSLSVRLVLRLEISSESNDDWRWDPEARVLHRLRPRRDRSVVPGYTALPHIRPLAERLVLQPGPAITAFLAQRAQQAPTATKLDAWFGSSKGAEQRVKDALATVAPRVTPAMFGGWVAQILFEDTSDPVLTHLLSSNSRSALPGSCAYAAYDQSAASRITRLGMGAKLTAEHASERGTINSAGSALHVRGTWIKERLQVHLARVNELSADPNKWLDHHNAFATYIVVVLLSATGARPVNSPFQAPSDFDLDRGMVYVEDKVSSLMHAGRLIPIGLTVANLIRTRYLEHLKLLASIVKQLDPDLGTEIELLSRKRDSAQLPFFFYLLRDESGLRFMEIGEKTLETLGRFTLDMQINVLRHRQSTWLKDKGADHEVINGLLGHADSGTATWGPFSARTWQADTEAVHDLLAESVKELGVSKPRLLVGCPLFGIPSTGSSSRPKRTDARYGREARAARTLRANVVARERAHQDIAQYLKERKSEGQDLHRLDKNDIERLEHLMLCRRADSANSQRGDYLPHPRAALRYEVFSDWIQQVRDVYGFVLPVKRRYLPRLEEPSPFSAESTGAREIFAQASAWHTTSLKTLNLASLETRERLAVAIAGVIIESRVANTHVVSALLMNHDIRVVRLDGHWHLEHAKFLDKFPLAPCTRYALSIETVTALLHAMKPEERPNLRRRVIRSEFKILAGILSLNVKSLSYEHLFKRLCAVVQQVNWQELPGLSAGYLDGSLVSVGLDHHSWYRLHRKQALLAPIFQGAGGFVSKSEIQDESDDSDIEPDATESTLHTTASPEDISSGNFTPVVQDSRFAPPKKPAELHTNARSQVPKREKSGRMTVATKAIAAQLAAPAEIPALIAMQMEARALMKAAYAAITSAKLPKTNVRRHIDAELRRAIEKHPAASVTCRIFVDWIRSLITTSTAGSPLAISSVIRYFVALSACFEQMAYESDLTKCEEEEVTELYANIMQARRQLKADMKYSDAAAPVSPTDSGDAKPTRMRYQTWNLALRLLRKFHRFSLRHYAIEDADWSEIGSEEETLYVSPRIILEREYLNALTVLVGNADDASLGETQAGMLLLLTYRFGLRAAEATNLTTSDLVEGPGEALHSGKRTSLLVLVRNNHFRKLKTDNARRQVPLLFGLADLENRLIERHKNHLDTAISRGNVVALFPDLAGKEHLGANMRMRSHVAQQLKASCSDPNVSLHTARHAFANLIASMLLDGTEPLRDRMFDTAPSPDWVNHVRVTVLCHAQTTRRSTWALARLMGHSHPRTAFRSYVHVVPEFTYARIGLHSETKQIDQDLILPIRGVIDLDALACTTEYLSPPANRAPRLDHLKPTSFKALLALSLIANGLAVPLVARKCDLTLESTHDLAWLEDEAIKAYGTLKRTKLKKEGLRPLLQHIRDEQLQRFRDRASSTSFDTVSWDSSLLTPNLLPATMIGPSRQIVLFCPEHFQFLASLMRQWGIDRDHLKVIKSTDLAAPVLEWATAAGFSPIDAPTPNRREPLPPQKQRDSARRLKPHYQVDTVKAGISRVRVQHRCAAVPTEEAGAMLETTYDLIALVVVHLFMLRANHPAVARETTAQAAARLDAHQLVV